MRKKTACGLLVLAYAVAVAGCQKGAPDNAGSARPAANTTNVAASGPEGEVEAALREVSSFTDELLKKFEAARDAAAGLAEAQKFFDARKTEVRARIVSARESRSARESEAAKGRLLENEVDNTSRVSGLQTKYLDNSMRDPAFKTRLDKLVSDYQELFRE